MVAVFLVDPERGRKVNGAVEGRDDVLNDFLLGEADLCGFAAIDVDLDRRRIEPVLNAHIDRAPNSLGVALDFFGDGARLLEFVALHLNVTGRRKTAVDRG